MKQPTFRIEHIQTIETTHGDLYYQYRINGTNCTIEINPDSDIEFGKQLEMELERVLNQITSQQKYTSYKSQTLERISSLQEESKEVH